MSNQTKPVEPMKDDTRISVKLPPHVWNNLIRIVDRSQRTKTSIINQVLEHGLARMLFNGGDMKRGVRTLAIKSNGTRKAKQ